MTRTMLKRPGLYCLVTAALVVVAVMGLLMATGQQKAQGASVASFNASGHGLPCVSITATARQVTEGQTATFRLTRTGALSDLAVTLVSSTTGNMVSATLDTSKTVPNNDYSVTLTVATDDDSTQEDHGSVTYSIDSGSNYTVCQPSNATVRIMDNDGGPTPTPTPQSITDKVIAVATYTEVTEGDNITFWLMRNSARGRLPVIMSWAQTHSVNGNVVSCEECVVDPAELTTLQSFQGEQRYVGFTIPTLVDGVTEIDQQLTLTLIQSTGYTIGENNSGVKVVTVKVSDP